MAEELDSAFAKLCRWLPSHGARLAPSNLLRCSVPQLLDNYQVTADVFFEQPGTVKLMGRIAGLNVNNGDMYGYELYVDNLGNWSLRQGNFVALANGSVSFSANAWHTLKMIFNGAAIGVVVDGMTVANVTTDDTYARGMVGLGVQSWATAEFDNFRIDPLPGAGIPVPQAQMTATATGEMPGYEGSSYYLVSQEAQGGDFWYDQGKIAVTGDAAVNSSVYSHNGIWYPIGSANTSYGPPNFKYTNAGAAQYVLTTAVSPAGSGTISANPPSTGGLYAGGTLVQLTATPSANCTFLDWSGDLTGSVNPQSVTIAAPQSITANFQCSAAPPNSSAFITGFGLSGESSRSDFTGLVGMKLTVGANALTISALGRVCLAGNAQTHTVKFVNAADGSDVAGASALVNMGRVYARPVRLYFHIAGYLAGRRKLLFGQSGDPGSRRLV